MENYNIRIIINTPDGEFTLDDGFTITVRAGATAAEIEAAAEAAAEWDEIADVHGVDVSAVTLSAIAQHPHNGGGDKPLLISKK